MSAPDDPKRKSASPEDDESEGAGGPGRALIGLLVLVLLIGAVVLIMYHLHQASVIQDCVAAGRSNCAPISVPGRN